MAESESNPRPWIKLVIGLVAVIAGNALAWNFGISELISMDNLDQLNSWFDGFGPWAPVGFILMWIASAVLFVGLSFVPGWVAARWGDTDLQSQD